jgi:signal peptidase II
LQERRALAPSLTPPAVAASVAALAVAADQLTKEWALRALADGAIHLFWTLRLQVTVNTGASFSIGRGRSAVFSLIGIVIVAVLVASIRGLRTTSTAVAMGLVVGGAMGNLTDRLVREHGGGVIDFIDFQWWPVFNVADICIFCGAVLLVLLTLRSPSEGGAA